MKGLLSVLMLLGACGADTELESNPVETRSSGLVVADFLGQAGHVELRPNHPFRAGYPELKWDGEKLVSQPSTRNDYDCYFFGDLTLEGQPSSAVVALRTCDIDGNPELSGVAFSNDQLFEIRQGQDGLVFEVVTGPEGACGVHADAPTLDFPAIGSSTATRQSALSFGEPAFIEVLLGRDEALLSGVANGDYAPDPVMTVHAAAAFYDRTSFGRRILPLLVGIVDASDTNPWGWAPFFLGRARAGGYVNNINDWAESNAASLPVFDQLTVLSGYNFTGSTVGLANVSSACDLGRSASVVKGVNNDASVAQTFGHELGHTIGMFHDSDGNACPQSGFVMTAVYNSNGPFATEFSSCSILYADPFLASTDSSCITLDAQLTYPGPYCGDGKVEGTEACDCGPMGCEGRDGCCTDSCEIALSCRPDEPNPIDMGSNNGVDMGTVPDAGSTDGPDTPSDSVDPDSPNVDDDLSSGGTDSGCSTTSSASTWLPLAFLVGLFLRRF